MRNTDTVSTDLSAADLPSSPLAVFEPIKEQILTGKIPGGARIPSVRKLSQLFGLPIRTVTAAIDMLVKDGLVAKRARSGIYAKSAQSLQHRGVPAGFKSSKAKAGQIADHLISGIVSGGFLAGRPLPLRKTLAFRYKSSIRTINAALEIVEQRGLVHRQGPSYVVGPQIDAGHPKGKQVILFATKRATGFFSHGWKEFFPEFEGELGRYGVSIAIEDKRKYTGNPSRWKGPSTIGFLFPATSYWMVHAVADNLKNLEKELRRLDSLRLPVVFHGRQRILALDPQYTFHPYRNVYVIACDNAEAGQLLGKYMASMGHSRVCFFAYGNHYWNPLRRNGFKRGLNLAWEGEAKVHVFETSPDTAQISTLFSRIIGEGRQQIHQLVSRLLRGEPARQADPTRQMLGFLNSLLHKETFLRSIRPVFAKALERTDATAWVCADPALASLAETYLAEKGIYAPRDLSLACVDDDENASFLRITCLSMPARQEGYLAAHALLGDIPFKRDCKGFVRYPGRIIERGSVARV